MNTTAMEQIQNPPKSCNSIKANAETRDGFNGTIQNIKGSVLILQKGKYVPAQEGMRIRSGNRMLSMRNSGATVTYDTKCVYQLQPLSIYDADVCSGTCPVIKTQPTQPAQPAQPVAGASSTSSTTTVATPSSSSATGASTTGAGTTGAGTTGAGTTGAGTTGAGTTGAGTTGAGTTGAGTTGAGTTGAGTTGAGTTGAGTTGAGTTGAGTAGAGTAGAGTAGTGGILSSPVTKIAAATGVGLILIGEDKPFKALGLDKLLKKLGLDIIKVENDDERAISP